MPLVSPNGGSSVGSSSIEMQETEQMPSPDPGKPQEPLTGQSAEGHLAERVREALRDHGDIDVSKIDVVVDGDYVILRGTVRSHWARLYAADLAAGVDGVDELQNDLEIERNADGTEVGGPTTDTRSPELPKGHFP